jgi:hypothetical protein
MQFNRVAKECWGLYNNFKTIFEYLVMEQLRVFKLYAAALDEPDVLPALVRFVPCNGSAIACFYCGTPTPVGPDTVRGCLRKSNLFPAYIMGCCDQCSQSIYAS